MVKKSNHIIPTLNGWSVKKTGSLRASRKFETKEKALIYGRELSKNENADLYIHKSNGMVQYLERNNDLIDFKLKPIASK